MLEKTVLSGLNGISDGARQQTAKYYASLFCLSIKKMNQQTGQRNSHHDFQPVRQAPETTLKLRALAPGRYQAISEPEYKKRDTDKTISFNNRWLF